MWGIASRLPEVRSVSARPPIAGAVRAAGRYRFARRFVSLAAAVIVLVGVGSSAFLCRTMVEQAIHHDGREVMQFVQGFTPLAEAEAFFRGVGDRGAQLEAMTPLLARIAALPGTLHVNVYDREKRVLWSTQREMIGRSLRDNPELDEALDGELEVESSLLEPRRYLKPEHAFLREFSDDFVETYVPIWSRGQREVLGVIEIYRQPQPLFEMTAAITRAVWVSAAIGGACLFAALIWLARRADRVIQSQHQQLVETETLAAVGEMSAAVAHSIRNPLAAIRSSAELAQELDGEAVRDSMGDVITHADRIAAWIGQLLVYAQPGTARVVPVDLHAVVADGLADQRRELEKRGIRVRTDLPARLPAVMGDAALMAQVLITLLSNALDAMPDGGEIALAARLPDDGARLYLFVSDTGVGIDPRHLERLFVPFQTTKKSGLGVGLPLVRRVMTRMGGDIAVESAPGRGTTVRLSWPIGPASAGAR